jgi:hypothetical protein
LQVLAVSELTKQQKIELALLLEERNRRYKQNILLHQWRSLYDWQLKFNAATADNRACMLMAANRVGKTRTGLTIDAFH